MHKFSLQADQFPLHFSHVHGNSQQGGCFHYHSVKLVSPLSSARSWTWWSLWVLSNQGYSNLWILNATMHPGCEIYVSTQISDWKNIPEITPSRHTMPFLLLWSPGLCWNPPNIIFASWVISEANSAISIPLQAVIFPILQPVNIWIGRKMGCFKGQIIFYLFSSILAYSRPRLLLKCLQFLLLLLFSVEFKFQW